MDDNNHTNLIASTVTDLDHHHDGVGHSLSTGSHDAREESEQTGRIVEALGRKGTPAQGSPSGFIEKPRITRQPAPKLTAALLKKLEQAHPGICGSSGKRRRTSTATGAGTQTSAPVESISVLSSPCVWMAAALKSSGPPEVAARRSTWSWGFSQVGFCCKRRPAPPQLSSQRQIFSPQSAERPEPVVSVAGTSSANKDSNGNGNGNFTHNSEDSAGSACFVPAGPRVCRWFFSSSSTTASFSDREESVDLVRDSDDLDETLSVISTSVHVNGELCQVQDGLHSVQQASAAS